jgi:potassium-dependent mechanosensitive channel
MSPLRPSPTVTFSQRSAPNNLTTSEQNRRTTFDSLRSAVIGVILIVTALAVESGAAQETESLLSSGAASFAAAEQVLETEGVATERLEEVRKELVEIRASAEALVDQGSVEARALQAQIEALGPAPLEDETEPEDITARRSELETALSEANAPVRDAQEAIARTNQLIGEIDARLRATRQASLLKRYPSPVNPAAWIALGEEVSALVEKLRAQNQWISVPQEALNDLQAPAFEVAAMIAVGLVVVFWVYPVVRRRLDAAARAAPPSRRRWALMIGENLSSLVLPGIGVGALLLAIPLLIRPPVGLVTLSVATPLAIFIIVSRWLGYTLFAPDNSERRLLPLGDAEAKQAFVTTAWLGVLLAIELVVEVFFEAQSFSDGAVSALSTPILLVTAWLLWRLARVLLTGTISQAPATDLGEDEPTGGGFLLVIARLLQVAAVTVTVALLAGFVTVARELLDDSAVTIGLLGLTLALYNGLVQLSRAALGRDPVGDEDALSLVPIGIGVALALFMAPLLAMIWGATPDDLAEVWRLATRGIQLGEIRFSFGTLFTLVVVFAIGIALTRWLQRVLRATVLPRTHLDPGVRSSLVTGAGYLGITLSALIAVSTAGLNLSSLAVVLGALSVGIGFGLQAVTSNFVSGLILLIERPIKEGDWIEVSGESGVVKKISVRSTRIETFDRHEVIIPNSDLMSGVVKNMTLSNRTGRLILPVGVAYGSDLDKTREILLQAAKAHDGVTSYPEPIVLFMGLGDSSLDFELRCFLRDVTTRLGVQSDLRFAIYAALNQAEIEIPFPQRDIHLRDIEQLVAAINGRKGISGDDRPMP